jgi:hypothetical protein
MGNDLNDILWLASLAEERQSAAEVKGGGEQPANWDDYVFRPNRARHLLR